jgi:hypothetical protein
MGLNKSIFDEHSTLCERAGNRCKLRKKCMRYIRPAVEGMDWVADYWQEFGSFCEEKGYFVPTKGEYE